MGIREVSREPVQYIKERLYYCVSRHFVVWFIQLKLVGQCMANEPYVIATRIRK